MLKNSLSICFFLFFSIELLAFQNLTEGKITYTVTFNIDSISKSPKNELLKAMINNLSDVNTHLYFKDSIGRSQVEPKFWTELNEPHNLTRILAGNNNIYYNNNSQNDRLVQTSVTGHFHLVSYPPIEWVITEEEKVINGYRTKKATIAEKDIIAWFATDIPSSHGPRGYSGLPGLILELHKKMLTYRVSKIQFEIVDDNLISRPTIGIKISFEDYFEKFKIK